MTHEPCGLREARRDDLDALAELHVETFKQTHGRFNAPNVALRRHQWRTAFDAPSGWFCYVVELDTGELVGFAKATLHTGGVPGFEGELNKIYVLRRYHRAWDWSTPGCAGGTPISPGRYQLNALVWRRSKPVKRLL